MGWTSVDAQPNAVANTCYLCGGLMDGRRCGNCGAISYSLGTSNIGKYRIGQRVSDMGTDKDISGLVASLEPSTPGATDGPGSIIVFEAASEANAGEQTMVAVLARSEASGAGLVGRRVEIPGKGQGEVTAVRKHVGRKTRHVIRFDNGASEELVLSKGPNLKGQRFHLLD